MANKIARLNAREQDPVARASNFEEVSYGFTPDEARLEASRCIQCKKPFCMAQCPVSIQIPQFIERVREGDFAAAADIISRDSLLPSVCGRVCPQETQCEGACVLGIKGESVNIGKLERFVGDWSLANGTFKPVKPTPNGKRVAIVGSGPAECWSMAFPSSACPRMVWWQER